MKLFSKETCQKLQKLGCVSESPFFSQRPAPIFTIADFLSDEPYALENCRRIKLKEVFGDCWHDDDFRHQLLEAPDQEAFILNALEGKI